MLSRSLSKKNRQVMSVKFRDLDEAFDFVSSGQMSEHQAFMNKETGKIFWQSDLVDDFEELPEDIDDEKYIEIPHKNELGLGKNLAIYFAHKYLPNEAENIESIFRRKGAYSRFKDILERKDSLEKWYEYESQAREKALKEWCEENSIKIHG